MPRKYLPRKQRVSGFTLVELLVVIAIIGMLMALLMPAIGAAREAARAGVCRNNMKNVALASISYESRFKQFPGYSNTMSFQSGNTLHQVAVPWSFEIMSDLDRNDLRDAWKLVVDNPSSSQSDKQNAIHSGDLAPYIAVFTCPSDPPLDQARGWTSFVANAGWDQADLAGCGLFHGRYPDKAPNGKKLPLLTTSLEQVSSGDGTGKTIMLSENKQAYTWDAISFGEGAIPTKKGLPHNVVVWFDTTTPTPTMLINGNHENFPVNEPVNTVEAGRPSSNHNGGVNVAYADGHVSLLNEKIPYNVYALLMSTDGKKCLNSYRQFSGNANANMKINVMELLKDSAL